LGDELAFEGSFEDRLAKARGAAKVGVNGLIEIVDH
jgi:hypothetical protein